MSDHTSALVPIETWCYMSPELRREGKVIDIGLFSEALVYYDHLYVIPQNSEAFIQFISWFVHQNKYGDLIALLKDDVVNFYYYSFLTSAIEKGGEYSIWNIQSEQAINSSMFNSECLTTTRLKQILPHARQRKSLHRAIEGKFIEAKANNFGAPINNAKRDYADPERWAILIQALLDEVYPMLNLKKPPIVKSQIVEARGKMHITWNVNLDQISEALGKELNFHRGSPLTAAGNCNRLLWSGAELGCDLYLPSPMSTLVGDKLYESGERLNRSKKIIEQLETEVEFPDIRRLVNNGQIGLKEVLELRQKGNRFRKWLQEEGEHDRNAIIAYHHEIAQESGWTKGGRKALGLFGILGGAAAAAAIGGAVAGIPGAILGATIEGGLVYVFDLASKLNEEWRPVVFGSWARERIQKQLSKGVE